MKVLLINKYNYLKGGSEAYFFGIKKMLEDNRHEVIVFSMKDEKNKDNDFIDYFVDNIDYQENNFSNKIKNAIKLISSKEAYTKLCRLIEDTKPDIAHVNLIYHQLTPSVFHALKKHNIPVVFTSHDYKLVCPNYKLFTNNEICMKCTEGKFVNCFFNKCHKDSNLYSLLLTIEAYYHKWKGSYEIADRVICPSEFMYKQLKDKRIPGNKLRLMPNFLTNDFSKKESLTIEKEDFILYYGRLSGEKGLDVLLDAKKLLKSSIQLKIIGNGPEELRLKERVQKEGISNVEFLGFKTGDDLTIEIEKARATIIPAVWHEVFGLTIIESFSSGTPVIGSSVGGITELIHEGKNGFLFERANPKELAHKIEKVFSISNEDYSVMVKYCFEYSKKFSPQKYYNELVKVYEEVINLKKNKNKNKEVLVK